MRMTQHTQSLPGLDLVEDVKHIVLQHITLYPDLRALCLTSRAWNHVATKYLYRNIVLDNRFGSRHLSVFMHCLQHGAERHLQYARSLSFLDIENTQLFSPLDVTEAEKFLMGSVRERNQLMLYVLQTLPENKLRTFRYISEHAIARDLLDYLKEHQMLIHTIHIPRSEPRQLISPTKRHIIAGFYNDAHKTCDFVDFAQELSPLESLYLLFWGGWTGSISNFWVQRYDGVSRNHQRIVTRELVMAGYMPVAFTSAIPHMFDLSMVTNLALAECNMWLFDGISRFTELRNLTHFRFSTMDSISSTDSEDFENFFRLNQNLRHVYLSLGYLAIVEPQTFPSTSTPGLPYLWPLNHGLKTLSLFDPWYQNFWDHNPDTTIAFPCFPYLKHVSPEFGGLQQLGIHASIQETIPPTSTREDVLFQHLGPIKLLKDLRILHLYQHPMQRVAAINAHQIAIRFFQTIHHHCPFLNVLILGSCAASSDDEIHTDLDMLNVSGLTIERTSQYRFVKREETLNDGQVQMTAVSVSLSRLRDEFPHLEMLNYDPGHQLLERVFHQQY